MTLTEFLLDRIDEDEAAALAMKPESERYPYSDRSLPVTPFDDLGDELRGYLGGPLGEHAARWHPARVLAECESKRRIVGQFIVGHDEIGLNQGGAEHLARLLALPYASHPDYDEAWRI